MSLLFKPIVLDKMSSKEVAAQLSFIQMGVAPSIVTTEDVANRPRKLNSAQRRTARMARQNLVVVDGKLLGMRAVLKKTLVPQ